MDDPPAIGDEQRDEARIEPVILLDQRLPLRAVRGDRTQRRGERLHGVLMVANVGAYMFAEGAHGFVKAPAAVAFLPCRRQLTVGGREQQHGQRRHEEKRMKRVTPQPALTPLILRDQLLGGCSGRDEIGDYDGDETADHELQRERKNGRPEVTEAENLRRDDQRGGRAPPDEHAPEERRSSAPRKGADDERFDRKRDHGGTKGGACRRRGDRRRKNAQPWPEQNGDRKRDDPAEHHRRRRAGAPEIQAKPEHAAEQREGETPHEGTVHRVRVTPIVSVRPLKRQ